MPHVPVRVHFAALQADERDEEAVALAGRGRASPILGENFSTLVIDPAVAHRADELHVLRPEKVRDTTLQFLEEQAAGRTRLVLHAVDFRVPAQAAGVVGTVIQSFGANPASTFLYNASSGPRESVLVAFLAAQFWPLQVYRVDLDLAAEPNPLTNEWAYKQSFDLPAPTRRNVGHGTRACLSQLLGGSLVRQKTLIDTLKVLEIIKAETGTLSPQAANSQFLPHARELVELGYAEKVGRGRNCKWKVTPNGMDAAAIMGIQA